MSKSKVANKVTGLQEFLDSLSKPEMKNGGLKPVNSAKNPGLAKLPKEVRNKMGYMQMGGKQPESFGSRRIKTVSVSPDRNYKTIVREKMGPQGGSTSVTNRRTVKGLMGGAPKPTKMNKGGMNIRKETMENATPSIPNSYYKMGGKKEMNPLRSIVKKNKMQMGGAFFPQNPLTASKYKKDTLMGQSFKKGGMYKKKNC